MKITERNKKIAIYLSICIFILFFISIFAVPAIISSTISSPSTKNKIEAIISSITKAKCTIKSINSKVSLLSSSLSIDGININQNGSNIYIKNIKGKLSNFDVLTNNLDIYNFSISNAQIKIIDKKAKGKLEISNINLYADIKSKGIGNKPIFTIGTSQGVAKISIGNAPVVNIGICKIDFNIKLSLTDTSIGFEKTTITTPVGSIKLSGNLKPLNQTGALKYNIAIKSSDLFQNLIPADMPEGLGFTDFISNGTIQLNPGEAPRNITLNGDALIKSLHSKQASINDIKINYALNNSILQLGLLNASIFNGKVSGNLSGNISRRTPSWQADAVIDGIDIGKAIKNIYPETKGISGSIGARVPSITARGWQKDKIIDSLYFKAIPNVESFCLGDPWFDYIKSGLMSFLSTQANPQNSSDNEIITLIGLTPSPYKFSIQTGEVTYQRKMAKFKNIKLESPDAFTSTINGNFKIPFKTSMRINLSGFDKLSGVDTFNSSYPIIISGSLPIPTVDFSQFFNKYKE